MRSRSGRREEGGDEGGRAMKELPRTDDLWLAILVVIAPRPPAAYKMMSEGKTRMGGRETEGKVLLRFVFPSGFVIRVKLTFIVICKNAYDFFSGRRCC